MQEYMSKKLYSTLVIGCKNGLLASIVRYGSRVMLTVITTATITSHQSSQIDNHQMSSQNNNNNNEYRTG